MRTRIMKVLLAGACGVLAACAIITVNVYFPEKDVKKAYKSLDEMLLKTPGDTGQTVTEPGKEPLPAPADKPQSMLFRGNAGFSLVAVAYAADDLADQLAVELSDMPEVLRAYEQMKGRLAQLDTLRDSGVLGETNQGLVSVRDKARIGDKQAFVDRENADRKTVITGMARAILKINKQPETKGSLNQVLGKAAASFADTKREAAKPGWWVQTQNGRWLQK